MEETAEEKIKRGCKKVVLVDTLSDYTYRWTTKTRARIFCKRLNNSYDYLQVGDFKEGDLLIIRLIHVYRTNGVFLWKVVKK